MSPPDRRYTRQVRLPEIGPAGQEKLCAAKVAACRSGFAAVIEERYVRLAGMQVAPDGTRVDADAGGLGLRHEAAREVAEGALAALAALRAALTLPEG